jgi:hypothetical protein
MFNCCLPISSKRESRFWESMDSLLCEPPLIKSATLCKTCAKINAYPETVTLLNMGFILVNKINICVFCKIIVGIYAVRVWGISWEMAEVARMAI